MYLKGDKLILYNKGIGIRININERIGCVVLSLF